MMRQHLPFYKIGIGFFTVLMGLASCSSSEEDFEPTPDNGSDVKTQMAIAVPQGGRSGRMTAHTVQDGHQFRGISNIWLVSLMEQNKNLTVNGPLNDLGTIDAKGQNGLGDFDDPNQNVKVYRDLTINAGTDQMLFYGMATSGSGQPFEEGVLSSNLTDSVKDLNAIQFSLQPCMSAENEHFADYQADQSKLLSGINGMLQAAASWGKPESGSLKNAFYKKICSLKAGSGHMIRLALQEIYLSIQESEKELKSDDEVKAVLSAIAAPDGSALFSSFVAATQRLNWKDTYQSLEDFPGNYGLPEGGVQLEIKVNSQTKADEYQYAAERWIGEEGESPTVPSNRINLKNICYPPALTYYVQSPLRVSNNVQISDWGSLWEEGWPAHWHRNAVDKKTRAIALENKVEYGTALLKTAFKCHEALLPHRADYPINVSGGLPVTGILVGGQPHTSGWNLQPKGSSSMDNVVYDRKMLGTTPLEAKVNDYGSQYNFTLVMPNVHTTEKDVPIAVEFINTTSEKIYGAAEGIIPPGGTFYLIGVLELPEKTERQAVFESDYFTTAKFNIKSLKNAYVTLPDLRAVKLNVGIYVDITWGHYNYGDSELGI